MKPYIYTSEIHNKLQHIKKITTHEEAMEVVKNNGNDIFHLMNAPHYTLDKDVIIEAFKTPQAGAYLKSLPAHFQQDTDICYFACVSNSFAIIYTPIELRNNPDFMYQVLTHSAPESWTFLLSLSRLPYADNPELFVRSYEAERQMEDGVSNSKPPSPFKI